MERTFRVHRQGEGGEKGLILARDGDSSGVGGGKKTSPQPSQKGRRKLSAILLLGKRGKRGGGKSFLKILTTGKERNSFLDIVK